MEQPFFRSQTANCLVSGFLRRVNSIYILLGHTAYVASYYGRFGTVSLSSVRVKRACLIQAAACGRTDMTSAISHFLQFCERTETAFRNFKSGNCN